MGRQEVNEAAEGQNNADGNFSWWCCRCRGWDIRDRNGIESVYPCFCGWYLEQHYRSICLLSTEETHEAVKREVGRLQAENARLNATVGELSETIDKLEDVEQALDVITQTQGQSVEAFAEQVKDNRQILGQMQKNLRANVLQNLLQVVIRSDQDDNMTIEEDEIDDLIDRLKKINGVEVKEDRFKQKIISAKGKMSCVMDIIKNLMADDVSKEDEIFIIKEESS